MTTLSTSRKLRAGSETCFQDQPKTRSSFIPAKSSILPSYPLTAKPQSMPPFLGSKKDFEIYELAQKELIQAASLRGVPTTVYPPEAVKNLKKGVTVKVLQDEGQALSEISDHNKIKNSVEQRRVRIHNKPYSSPLQRGLFANRNFKKGEFVVPYDGEILTQEQFQKKYPAKEKGTRLFLRAHEFRKDESAGADENSVQIRDCVKNYGGMKGEIIKRLEGTRQTVIQLDGWHEAQHTLSVPSSNLLIDAESTLEKDTYLLGAGALINSSDVEFGKGLKPNVEYRVCPTTQKAIVVATENIPKGTEFFSSYLQENVVIEKDEGAMWKKVGIAPMDLTS